MIYTMDGDQITPTNPSPATDLDRAIARLELVVSPAVKATTSRLVEQYRDTLLRLADK